MVEGENPLRCVVVYEDAPTQLRALDMYNYLVIHLGHEIGLQFSWWSFDLLRESAQAQEATRTATTADLVIFSAKPAMDWPLAIKSWVDTWAGRHRSLPGAIGMLMIPIESKAQMLSGRQAYLQTMAAKSGMDFLEAEVGPAFASSINGEAQVLPPLPARLPVASNPLDQLHSSSHWGIND